MPHNFCRTLLVPMFLLLGIILTLPQHLKAQAKLSVHWEELTAADFREGIHRSQGVCLLPFGILGKPGRHFPFATDLWEFRYAPRLAAEGELAAGLPNFYFGQFAK